MLIAAQANGFDSPRWATFRQWKALGGHVKKGEHGTKIVYWNIVKETATDPATGEEEVEKRIFARQYVVFNLCQTGGESLERFREQEPVAKPFFDYAPAEHLIESTGARLQFGGNRACYSPQGDCIRLPEKQRFDTEADYYSTALHELAHWTGHESRLNRLDKLSRFGDESYSMEELVAEMAVSFLCATLGIENLAAESQSASYLASWLNVLKADRTAIFTASKLAAAASDYLLSFSPDSVPAEAEPEPVPFRSEATRRHVSSSGNNTAPDERKTIMACVEHSCRSCGHVWINNSTGRECPECGSTDSARFFDER